ERRRMKKISFADSSMPTRVALLSIALGVAACSGGVVPARGDDGGVPPKMPPPVVGPCNALGEPGHWEKISPPGVLDTQAIALDPLHVGTLFLGASPNGIAGNGAGGLWRSTDIGGHKNVRVYREQG